MICLRIVQFFCLYSEINSGESEVELPRQPLGIIFADEIGMR